MTEAVAGDARSPGRVPAPRLARHVVTLDDGHQVQLAIAGRGVPLVVVHGYTAEGILYAQSLSRLVSSGFKVIAIDSAGHGGTDGLRGTRNLRDYARLLGRVLRHLGVRRAVYIGHSMGGRLVAQHVARDPRRAIAVVLVDAIVGETWDRMVRVFRVAPPLLAITGATLAVDTLTTPPVASDPRQAVKLTRLASPVFAGHIRRPWNLVEAAVSILRSGPSRWMLDRLADERVPVFVIHGDRDLAVPIQTARDTARRARGELVTVHGATHSWLLKDPETLPGIMAELLEHRMGAAIRVAEHEAGLDAGAATLEDTEQAFCEPDALVLRLTPPLDFDVTGARRAPPRYRWTSTWP